MCQRDPAAWPDLQAALSRDLARDTLNPFLIQTASGVANLAYHGREKQERHKAAATRLSNRIDRIDQRLAELRLRAW
jgi:hypothetical protein